ncbi:Helix-turn-helix domain protein [compost metagenome]
MKIEFKDPKAFQRVLMSKGYSQRGFASYADISGPYMSQIIKGKRNPSPNMAKKICDTLDLKFDDIFFIDNGYKSKQNKTA